MEEDDDDNPFAQERLRRANTNVEAAQAQQAVKQSEDSSQ